ncbi:unnamed protein product [Trichobilharzia szidati]|nr:unnamed protein product [Trichobilharzia szidati]
MLSMSCDIALFHMKREPTVYSCILSFSRKAEQPSAENYFNMWASACSDHLIQLHGHNNQKYCRNLAFQWMKTLVDPRYEKVKCII